MPEVHNCQNGGDGAQGLLSLPVLGDERGSLVVIESSRNVPFNIERVYYLLGTREGVARGCHAHRTLRQFAIAVHGSCTMLFDDGRERRQFILDRADRGILIPPMTWHELSDFSSDCVLLVLADAHYDEDDYIRDYSTFIDEARIAEA